MNHELDFPAGIWEPFAQNRPPVRCSAGYLIYLQDTQATCFYCLKSGRVKSFIQSEDGGSRVLHSYSAGNLFGEAAFFDGLPRVSSAVAVTPCALVAVDRPRLEAVFVRHPDLAVSASPARSPASSERDAMPAPPASCLIACCLLSPPPYS